MHPSGAPGTYVEAAPEPSQFELRMPEPSLDVRTVSRAGGLRGQSRNRRSLHTAKLHRTAETEGNNVSGERKRIA
eukprot:15462158-Alexandrium_andersonii.AAC.1